MFVKMLMNGMLIGSKLQGGVGLCGKIRKKIWTLTQGYASKSSQVCELCANEISGAIEISCKLRL